jgi:hypothetical protein
MKASSKITNLMDKASSILLEDKRYLEHGDTEFYDIIDNI